MQNLLLHGMLSELDKGAGSPCPAGELPVCSFLSGNAETPNKEVVQLSTLIPVSTGPKITGPDNDNMTLHDASTDKVRKESSGLLEAQEVCLIPSERLCLCWHSLYPIFL